LLLAGLPLLAWLLLAWLLLAWLLTGLMTTLLYEVGRHDPATFAIVAMMMIVVGIVATIVPAVRATRVDPIITLRAD